VEEKIFQLPWIQHKREGTNWPAATPFLLRLLFCWQECILFQQKRERNDDKVRHTHKKKKYEKKKPYCPFWNNNLFRHEREDISLPSMKNKTKACATPNIPVHLVGVNWIKNSHPEVRIVPLPVFVALNQRLLAVWHNFRNYFSPLGQYFTAATPSARVYKEDTNNETCKGRFQGYKWKLDWMGFIERQSSGCRTGGILGILKTKGRRVRW